MAEQWMSITDAASALTAAGDRVDRTSLSRYLKQHADALPLKPAGKSNLVDFKALVLHRGENMRVRQAAPTVVGNLGQQPTSSDTNFPGTKLDGSKRKANADAEIREMDLAERRKELTPTDEVDQAGRDAVALMQSAFERAVEGEAQKLSLQYGWEERVVRIALKGFARAGVSVFNRLVLEKLDAMRRDDVGVRSIEPPDGEDYSEE
ncbi:hypothetical protein NBH19_08925 [Rhizobium sp. S95]|uniref:Uncharacterized protein n=1 Tax=Ciceribacter sichuanensis TaxID=2949647 RepID=A0AAJ1F7Z7_9HYPH|nr:MULTISPECIES: hypothetical protein [unclassified Ciceribacter]MCM2396200.1 hypothetical protein [Ciceribacter sp. S95]MCO5957649.1 hypothetical protein [Ciceribacter sp. S101]